MSQQARNNPDHREPTPNIPTLSDADLEEQNRQHELAEVPDFWVLRAMLGYGGSFAKALAKAGCMADPENLARIKAAWPEYWVKYAEVALPKWQAYQAQEAPAKPPGTPANEPGGQK